MHRTRGRATLGVGRVRNDASSTIHVEHGGGGADAPPFRVRTTGVPDMPESRPSRRPIARSRACPGGGVAAHPSAPSRSLARTGSLAVWLVAAAAGAAPVSAAQAQDEPDRGEALYENHCGECHGVALHRRETPRVRSREELYGWVAAWSVHAGTPWSEEEIESVTSCLSGEVYGAQAERRLHRAPSPRAGA